jgi:hypothetical protein
LADPRFIWSVAEKHQRTPHSKIAKRPALKWSSASRSICARMMGGDVTVTSESGKKGSVFTVRLPGGAH